MLKFERSVLVSLMYFFFYSYEYCIYFVVLSEKYPKDDNRRRPKRNTFVPIVLCKLDTNGNDVYVINSAETSLKRCSRIVMEIVGPQDGTGPPDQYERAIEITKKLGFRLDPRYLSAKRQSGSYDLYFERPEARNQPDTSDLYHDPSTFVPLSSD